MSSQKYRSGPPRFSLLALLALVLAGLVPAVGMPRAAGAAPSDTIVIEWNQHAVTAFTNAPSAPTPGAGMPPQVSILHIAMVQGAIYDAIVMIEGGYQPYSDGLPTAADGASVTAAVATAAHRVLVGVQITPPFAPAVISRLDNHLANSLAAATASDGAAAVAAGVAAGEAAAEAMLAARANDGRYVPTPVPVGTQPGEWRPTPPTNGPDPFAWVGNVEPFLVESQFQFRSQGPNPVNSRAYTRDYNEVKRLGGPSADSPRTPQQEALAQFFTVNPTELFNRAFRTFAPTQQLTAVEQARLFAMLNMAGADALITCFNDKLRWNYWRPITAIRLGDDDGNRSTVGDPNWSPMVGTPAYSEHASGYNCVTAAVMHTADDFFNELGARRPRRMSFSLVRSVPGSPDVTRTYKRFTDVIPDTIDARIYQGIHFRTSDEQGAQIGRDVADWLDQHDGYFNPVK